MKEKHTETFCEMDGLNLGVCASAFGLFDASFLVQLHAQERAVEVKLTHSSTFYSHRFNLCDVWILDQPL